MVQRQYWLMKSEPDCFSWDHLVAQGKAEWDGVRNAQAANNMKAMKKGDLALFYHSQTGLEAVGVMEVVEEAKPDSTDESGRWVAVHVAPKRKLWRGVSLKEMKADPSLANMKMLRQSRLSVAPLTEGEFERILELAGERPG